MRQRVYDEDVGAEDEEAKEADSGELTHEQMEAILMPKYTQAVAYGMNALEMSKIVAEEHRIDLDDDDLDGTDDAEEQRKKAEQLVRVLLLALVARSC